jgi:hypothetical protein
MAVPDVAIPASANGGVALTVPPAGSSLASYSRTPSASRSPEGLTTSELLALPAH